MSYIPKLNRLLSIPVFVNERLKRLICVGGARAAHTRSVTFGRVVGSEVDTSVPEFQTNKNLVLSQCKNLDELLKIAIDGGGPKGYERHVVKQKKVLARDRVSSILDENSPMFEIGALAGMNMEYGDVPGASAVTVIGEVHGQKCMVVGNDATVKGGTMFPIGVKKQLRAQEIAQQNNLPCIYIVDSGGAFLPLQAEIFPDANHGGKVFASQAIMSSLNIPQIALVCGNCTAGGAYVPTMCDEAIIVHRIGTIFLGGPPLVHAATGEVVSAEDLGGATMHCGVSGCTDHFAATEEEGFELVRDIVATLDLPSPEPRAPQDPLYDPHEILGLIPGPQAAQSMDMIQVLARIVDGSRLHLFKPRYGTRLITAFARIHGHVVGVVANAGSIGADEAVKSSHFLELCEGRRTPVVFLHNTPPLSSLMSHHGEGQGDVIRAHAKLLSILATLTVPKISVMAGPSLGVENYLMCGRSMSPNFVFSWPSAVIGIAAPGELQQSLLELGLPEDKVAPLVARTSAVHSSSRLWDDSIIKPHHTRQVVGECLDIVTAYPSQEWREDRPVIRM